MDFSSELAANSVQAHLNSLSIAPMVDHTDRHCRHLLRLIAPKATLYTEMIVAQAVLRGDPQRLLDFSETEHPVIAQLADSDPSRLADASQVVEAFGYDAVNLNIGCPSARVKSGGFGACLLERPDQVVALVRAMHLATSIPVTVKCRIGTDRVGGFEWLKRFVKDLAGAGAAGVVIHARIADLSGFSTHYNLNVPPLDWDMVKRLQKEVDVPLTLNGGLVDLAAIQQVTTWIDRVMVGRTALKRPDIVAAMHDFLYGACRPFEPMRIARAFRNYLTEELASGVPLHAMTRHALSLFHGLPGARVYRQYLSMHAPKSNASIEVFDHALAKINNSLHTRERETLEAA